jgi:Domain of unknown function (DUF4382)
MWYAFSRRPVGWGLALLVLPLAAGACSDTGTNPAGRTTVSVYVKDAPGDVDSVWVQIDDIVLVGDSGQTSLLAQPTGLVNLTSLRDSAMALVTDQDIAGGSFHEVRFVLGGAVLETAQGDVYAMGGAEDPDGLPTTGTLQCPSCAQSGIKVKLADDLVVDDGTDNGLLLDFDVSQSFGHQAGNSGKWVMHPVIHGTMASPGDIEGGTTGALVMGTVALGDDAQNNPVTIPACGGQDRTLAEFVPTATATTLVDDENNPLSYTGVTTEDGTFSIEGLAFDTWTLGYGAETVFDTEKLVWQATVDPAQAVLDSATRQVAGVTYTVTGVSCEAVTP